MASLPQEFSELRQAARTEFNISSHEFDSPKNYTFEDFEHDLIVDSIIKVEENNLFNPYENEVISSYAALIESGLRAMRDGVDTDSNDILVSIISTYLKKKAH